MVGQGAGSSSVTMGTRWSTVIFVCVLAGVLALKLKGGRPPRWLVAGGGAGATAATTAGGVGVEVVPVQFNPGLSRTLVMHSRRIAVLFNDSCSSSLLCWTAVTIRAVPSVIWRSMGSNCATTLDVVSSEMEERPRCSAACMRAASAASA